MVPLYVYTALKNMSGAAEVAEPTQSEAADQICGIDAASTVHNFELFSIDRRYYHNIALGFFEYLCQ